MEVNFNRYNLVFLLFLILFNCSYSLSVSNKNTKHLSSPENKDRAYFEEKPESEKNRNLENNQEKLEKEKNNYRNIKRIQNEKDELDSKLFKDYNSSDNTGYVSGTKNSTHVVNEYPSLEINPVAKNNSALELETRVNYVERKFGMSFIQSKIDPSHFNSKGAYLISIKATEAHRLSKFIWAIVIVILLSIACYFIVKYSVDWVNICLFMLNLFRQLKVKWSSIK
jgi:hypothetical protein